MRRGPQAGQPRSSTARTSVVSVDRPSGLDLARPATATIPYLPGLDSLRALAVVAVMVYHANPAWLPGGFLGVEVFFVLSGYLITALLVVERESTGRVDVRAFWLRRARRLLPALAVVLIGVAVVTAAFRTDAAGRLRGDLVVAGGYVTNWYQLWIGSGYTAVGDFAPLRHLWSLAIEEQFYLVWPVVLWLVWRPGRRVSRGLVAWVLMTISVAIFAANAALVASGPTNACGTGPAGDWDVAGRCIDVADALYLSTLSRAPALLLGAAFALVWRPATPRVRVEPRLGRLLDAGAVTGLVVLGVLAARVHYMTATGLDPFLFRGGLVLTDLATIATIAAVARHRAWTYRGRLNRSLRWIGARSYGWYLVHWPVYQLVRGVAGRGLSVAEFAASLAVTVVLAELSYRHVELPIRRHGVRVWWADITDRRPRAAIRQGSVATIAGAAGLSLAVVAVAPVTPNSIEQAFAAGRETTASVEQLLAGSGPTTTAPPPGDVPSGPDTVPASGAALRAAPAPPPTASVPDDPPVPPSTGAPAASDVSTAAPGTDDGEVRAQADVVPAAESGTGALVESAVAPPDTGDDPRAAGTAPGVEAEAAVVPPSSVAPPVAIDRLAIGDSVMLGASPQLAERGWVVNAEVGRQGADAVELVEQLAAADVVGELVVLHLGTNGPVGDETWDALLAPLADVDRVVLVTIRADRSWSDANSGRIRERAGGNVVVLDWAVESQACPGRCFEPDGIHLRHAGREFFADLVDKAAAPPPPMADRSKAP